MADDKSRITLMINKLWNEAQCGRIEDDWACGFLMDMKSRLKLNRTFSENQIAKIEVLFERY